MFSNKFVNFSKWIPFSSQSILLIGILLLIQLTTNWNIVPILSSNDNNSEMPLDGSTRTTMADAFIFWKATTTACDICDGIDTNSGRNLVCCLLQSKCCGFKTLDEAEEIRANATAAAAAQ